MSLLDILWIFLLQEAWQPPLRKVDFVTHERGPWALKLLGDKKILHVCQTLGGAPRGCSVVLHKSRPSFAGPPALAPGSPASSFANGSIMDIWVMGEVQNTTPVPQVQGYFIECLVWCYMGDQKDHYSIHCFALSCSKWMRLMMLPTPSIRRLFCSLMECQDIPPDTVWLTFFIDQLHPINFT